MVAAFPHRCDTVRRPALTSPSQADPVVDGHKVQQLDDLLDDVPLDSVQKQRLDGVDGAVLLMTPDASKRLILAAEADIKARRACGFKSTCCVWLQIYLVCCDHLSVIQLLIVGSCWNTDPATQRWPVGRDSSHWSGW